MKKLIYSLLILGLFISHCKPEENDLPSYTFKGRIFNATEQTVPKGLQITLKAHNLADGLTKYKEEILGTAITDTLGRFSITYRRSNLLYITLSSQFFIYPDLPLLNRNIDTTFYRSTKGTLIYRFIADDPLLSGDTLYFTTPHMQTLQLIIGPKSAQEIYAYKGIGPTTTKGYWGIGKKSFDAAFAQPSKYPNQVFYYVFRYDPYVDSVTIKYR